MTVYLVIILPTTPYIHLIYMVLANPNGKLFIIIVQIVYKQYK